MSRDHMKNFSDICEDVYPTNEDIFSGQIWSFQFVHKNSSYVLKNSLLWYKIKALTIIRQDIWAANIVLAYFSQTVSKIICRWTDTHLLRALSLLVW